MMVKELIFLERGLPSRKEEKEMKLRRVEISPELSLGPSGAVARESANSRPSASAVDRCRKRKFPWDDHLKTGFELQLKNPLPIDSEKCLDFEPARMNYMKRSTSKKCCNCPKEQKLDLDLNISTLSHYTNGGSSKLLEDPKSPSNSSPSMVAIVCLKCHLLVMLHKTSPYCPNCKYLHSFLTRRTPHPNTATTKPMETLSLLN